MATIILAGDSIVYHSAAGGYAPFVRLDMPEHTVVWNNENGQDSANLLANINAQVLNYLGVGENVVHVNACIWDAVITFPTVAQYKINVRAIIQGILDANATVKVIWATGTPLDNAGDNTRLLVFNVGGREVVAEFGNRVTLDDLEQFIIANGIPRDDGTHYSLVNEEIIGNEVTRVVRTVLIKEPTNMITTIFGNGVGRVSGLGHKDNQVESNNTDIAKGDNVRIIFNSAILRYGLIRFDVSSIPSNAIVSTAMVSFRVNQIVSAGNVSLHRLLTQWGITDFDAGLTEHPAASGQATYRRSIDFNGVGGDAVWAGGGNISVADFEAVADDTVARGGVGDRDVYSVKDTVQEIIEGSLINNGWIIVSAIGSSNWYDSFDATIVPNSPTLTVV